MNQLPESYCESMRILLGEEYKEYVKSLSQETYTAFRVNTGKISLEEWEEKNPFHTEKISWTEKGFYYQTEKDKPSKHPYYYAGLYYIQEPSAMIPASVLPIAQGDKVLDLCAAPGGKATELGARLDGRGLLVANDISVSRAMALAKNLQLAGITNAVVTAETPERLANHFGAYFDKILIDAPCSGEGMFRREPRMIKDWMEKGPDYYSSVQKQILTEACRMLKPGGQLVYSTCTFSVKEDEAVVQWLLDQYSDMRICPVERKEGFSEGRPELVENGSDMLRHCIRIFPHKAKGEGHFAVLLKKIEKEAEQEPVYEQRKSTRTAKGKRGTLPRQKRSSAGDENAVREMHDFVRQLNTRTACEWAECLEISGETLLSSPLAKEKLHGIRMVYGGLTICEWKHRVIPSAQLALTLKAKEYEQVCDFVCDDDRVIRYLKGETLTVQESYKGSVLVCVDGYGLGWAQGNGQGTLKNKYHPGWRYQ